MGRMTNWRGTDVDFAVSAGGVRALATVGQRGPDRCRSLAASRADSEGLPESAITWSVFGPIAYASAEVRARFIRDLLRLIDVPCDPFETATVWLWRRLPDTLVPGGPEIDFGVQTDTLFLLGEAKWLSAVAAKQGALGDKDQLMLRREFCEKYGRRLLPTCRRFVVLGVSLNGSLVPTADTTADGVTIHGRDTTWDSVIGLDSHPLTQELRAYLAWKRGLSRMASPSP